METFSSLLEARRRPVEAGRQKAERQWRLNRVPMRRFLFAPEAGRQKAQKPWRPNARSLRRFYRLPGSGKTKSLKEMETLSSMLLFQKTQLKREDRKPKGNGDQSLEHRERVTLQNEAGRQKAERQW